MAAPVYQPSAWQQRFHRTRADEVFGAGSAGPGKTVTLTWDPLEQVMTEATRCQRRFDPKNEIMVRLADWALERAGETDTRLRADAWAEKCTIVPGNSVGWALHVRRTRTMLDQTLLKFRRGYLAVDPGMHWDNERLIATFSSGLHFQFGHMKDPMDWEQYFSNEYTHIAFDELIQFLENQYDQLKSRLRTSDWVLARMLRCVSASNPVMTHSGEEFTADRNPYWVRERFVDPAPEGNTLLRKNVKMSDGSIETITRIYLPAKLADNPDPEFARRYEIRLRDMKPHVRRALLDGDWYVVAGAFYSDAWNPNLHVCEPFAIPSDWPVFRSMDWGHKAPGCIHWAALDPEGTLFVFREVMFRLKSAAQMAQRVKDVEEDEGCWDDSRNRSGATGWADTQLWERRGDVGRSKAEEFAARGVTWIPADKKSRRRNAERLLERLTSHEDGKTAPGIVFFKNCVNAIRLLPSIPTDPTDSEVPMDGGQDHPHDSILYLVAGVSRYDGGEKRYDVEDEDDDGASGDGEPSDGYGGGYD